MSNRKRQRGFSLLELMVAMMIIAVIGTLGFKQYKQFASKALYTKAQDNVKTFSEALDLYFLKHHKYPELTSWEAGVEANSVLVKQNMIAANMPTKDPWDQPYEVKSGKGTYLVKCLGDPNDQEERPAFSREPGRISGPESGGSTGGTAAPAAAPTEGGTAK